MLLYLEFFFFLQVGKKLEKKKWKTQLFMRAFFTLHLLILLIRSRKWSSRASNTHSYAHFPYICKNKHEDVFCKLASSTFDCSLACPGGRSLWGVGSFVCTFCTQYYFVFFCRGVGAVLLFLGGSGKKKKIGLLFFFFRVFLRNCVQNKLEIKYLFISAINFKELGQQRVLSTSLWHTISQQGTISQSPLRENGPC